MPHLIHILAKHDTSIKANNTVFGFVPARLNTFVISTRSMLVLLSADEIVNPPMRSMIVGENIVEKTNLKKKVGLPSGTQHKAYNSRSSRCWTQRTLPIWRTDDPQKHEQ